MRVFKPSYYDEFRCIADKCRHNCCIGWEIDVDEDMLVRYMTEYGEFGDRLRANISLEDECPHFILGEGERCPFLNENNLCDIIINMGEDCLCQICSDHPRFVNCSEDREEIGLGMCCEEAARLIITYEDKVRIEGEKIDEDAVIFNVRDMVIERLQLRGKTIDERIADVKNMFGIKIPEKKWDIEYLKLEMLDKSWADRIMSLRGQGHELTKDWSLPFEQILVYFIYRYMTPGQFDGRYNERVTFAILSFYIIREMFKRSEESIEELIEICRRYSCEIEYSEENVEKLLVVLENA